MNEGTSRRQKELEPHEVERWAHSTTTGSVGRKAVLQYLAARADEKGACFPGQAVIGRATEQGERTVRRHLADMTEVGLLCHRARAREDGRGRTSDRYFLHVDDQCGRPDCPNLLPEQPANLAGKSDGLSGLTGHQVYDQPATGGRGEELPENYQLQYAASLPDDAPENLDGMPLQPTEGLSFATTLARWLGSENLPPRGRRDESYAALVRQVDCHVPKDHPKRTGVFIGVLADYVADVAEVDLANGARGHLGRLIKTHGPIESLRGLAEAVVWGAGLDDQRKPDVRDLTKYATAVINGKATT